MWARLWIKLLIKSMVIWNLNKKTHKIHIKKKKSSTCDHCQWVICPIMLSLDWGSLFKMFYLWPLGGTAVNGRWGTTSFLSHTSCTQHPPGSARFQCHILHSATCFVQCTVTHTHTISHNCHEAQWTNLIGPSFQERQEVCVCGVILLSELPVTIFNLHNLPQSHGSGRTLTDFTVTKIKTRLLS